MSRAPREARRARFVNDAKILQIRPFDSNCEGAVYRKK